ncbi:MAG TPA: VOC family protein [Bacteroidia bacterium]|nr:VOC family protein [Bacteroidia bacterium]
MDTNTNIITWFEVPVSDFDRAQTFYETIFDIQINALQMGPLLMGLFPSEQGNGKVSGALCQHEWYKPSSDGPLIYFNANPNLQTILDRVEKSGGKIIVYKKQISQDIGYMAVVIDTEGNRIALHSQN